MLLAIQIYTRMDEYFLCQCSLLANKHNTLPRHIDTHLLVIYINMLYSYYMDGNEWENVSPPNMMIILQICEYIILMKQNILNFINIGLCKK